MPKVVFGASIPQRVVAVVVLITPVVMVNPVANCKARSGVGPEGTGRSPQPHNCGGHSCRASANVSHLRPCCFVIGNDEVPGDGIQPRPDDLFAVDRVVGDVRHAIPAVKRPCDHPPNHEHNSESQ